MMRFIKKIQEKPKSTRVLILWFSTGLVMILIIAIWLFSFSYSPNIRKEKEEAQNLNLPSLFKSIKNDFSSLKEKMEASLKNIDTENLQENEPEQ